MTGLRASLTHSTGRVRLSGGVAGMAMVLAACAFEDPAAVTFSEAEWAVIQTMSPLPEPPIDPTSGYDGNPAAEALGHALFFERSHSGAIITGDDGENGGLGQPGDTGRVACADCHMPEHWYHDVRSVPNATTLGIDWTPRNTPTVVNAIYYDWLSWSGAAETMWQEAIGATLRPTFQGSTRLSVAHMIYERYRGPYEELFGALDPRLDPAHPDALPPRGNPGDPAYDGLDEADRFVVDGVVANYGKAIAAYCRLLVSRDASFDRFVAGDEHAISAAAKRGLKLFIGKAGCVDCHSGSLLSDNEFYNLGVPQYGEYVPASDSGRYDAISLSRTSDFSPYGRYSNSIEASTLFEPEATDLLRGRFRTKSLRNVAETGPYMHTGGLGSLVEVIEFYDHGGGTDGFEGEKDGRMVPLGLTENEVADLAAFLDSLTGEPVDAALTAPPEYPGQ